MNDTLKVAGRIGAELGAAMAENEMLRELLRDVEFRGALTGWEPGLIGQITAALSQQAEPTDTYTAVEMATAAAQGFRDGQAAVEQDTAQDERKTFEVEIPDISAIYDGRSFIPYRSLEAGERLMTVAQHLRIEKQLRAALTRPAQTERQALVAWATRLYNTGYHAGHNDTVEGGYTHVYQQDMDSYHEEVALEWLTDNPQPAPPARHSQTEQQPTVKDCLTVQPMAYAVFADNGNVACFSTQREHPSLVAFESDGHSVVSLAPIAQTAQGDDQ